MEDRPLSTIEKAAARLATLKPEPVSTRPEKVADDVEGSAGGPSQDDSLDIVGLEPRVSNDIDVEDVEVEEIVAEPIHPTPLAT
ncbi:MAG: hypothetical protein ACE1ZA_00265, partial [Pseudomonadales bacterium]